ncbi:MAG: DNA-binding domain-containing protein [Alphaproteobacteria bacterium]
MLPRLSDVQDAFRGEMLGAGTEALDDLIASDGLHPAQRLQIYRNHYSVTLIDALASTFPVTQRLVGDSFFAMAARRFIRTAPPASPCLYEYGADFPGHLDGMPEAASLPYLGDVARFEWAINAAYHAVDVPTADPAMLQRVPADRQGDLVFILHPSVQLVSSAYPVLRIWRTNQPDATPEPAVTLAEGRCRLLVLRSDTDVIWRELMPAEFVFLYGLRVGRSLAEAFASATAAGTPFDLANTLRPLIDHGGVADLVLPSTNNRR